MSQQEIKNEPYEHLNETELITVVTPPTAIPSSPPTALSSIHHLSSSMPTLPSALHSSPHTPLGHAANNTHTPIVTNTDQSLQLPPQTRLPSPSQSFLTHDEQSKMLQLPKEFSGAAKLIMPAYLTGPISNVTLPSRLDLLGRRGYKILGSFFPKRIGNSVLGWSPVLVTSWKTKSWKFKPQLFVLPSIFSKSMARILLFCRIMFLLIVIILGMNESGLEPANPGRVWVIGVGLALIVMYKQSKFRRAPDGVMSFCRSMGVPDVEEYMFSYCWKVEPENVRTLAKSVWKAGVGVWIDVVKLCPGDEIRPMVRTTVARVHKVVVFLSQEYCDSPNCCVEMMEAIQHPEKVTICIIKNNIHPQIMKFLIGLKPRGLRMCQGFDELISILDLDVQDMSDIAAFQWWRAQSISGAGVPDTIVPHNWPMSRFSFTGRLLLPDRSIEVGPVFLSGDCRVNGQSLKIPWLLVIAIAGVAINVYDIWSKYYKDSDKHYDIDYAFLAVVAACNCAPFVGFSYLLDTRRDCHVALRPLLASRSMGGGGIKVRVVGHDHDPIYRSLRTFLQSVGHLAPDYPVGQVTGRGNEPRCVTVYIMESLARRDELFGRHNAGAIENRFSLFIWSGFKERPSTVPFTDDEVGQRLMRYLVLIVDWEKHGLAESLFSAIGVRVVDILHEKPQLNSHTISYPTNPNFHHSSTSLTQPPPVQPTTTPYRQNMQPMPSGAAKPGLSRVFSIMEEREEEERRERMKQSGHNTNSVSPINANRI